MGCFCKEGNLCLRLPRGDRIKDAHLYFALMCLSLHTTKCGIPREELVEDAYSPLELSENIKAGEENHFKED